MDIGTIVLGTEIGRKYRNKYIWVACSDCGKERWVMLTQGNPRSNLCHFCSLQRIKPWFAERKNRRHQLCLDCNKPIRRSKSGYCQQCRYNHPEYNPGWKGGRIRDHQGHILIKISSRKPGDKGYIREHLLIWESTHGKLPTGFVIHHLNGIPDDNRLENLVALPMKRHNTILKAYKAHIRQLEQTVHQLKHQQNLL